MWNNISYTVLYLIQDAEIYLIYLLILVFSTTKLALSKIKTQFLRRDSLLNKLSKTFHIYKLVSHFNLIKYIFKIILFHIYYFLTLIYIIYLFKFYGCYSTQIFYYFSLHKSFDVSRSISRKFELISAQYGLRIDYIIIFTIGYIVSPYFYKTICLFKFKKKYISTTKFNLLKYCIGIAKSCFKKHVTYNKKKNDKFVFTFENSIDILFGYSDKNIETSNTNRDESAYKNNSHKIKGFKITNLIWSIANIFSMNYHKLYDEALLYDNSINTRNNLLNVQTVSLFRKLKLLFFNLFRGTFINVIINAFRNTFSTLVNIFRKEGKFIEEKGENHKIRSGANRSKKKSGKSNPSSNAKKITANGIKKTPEIKNTPKDNKLNNLNIKSMHNNNGSIGNNLNASRDVSTKKNKNPITHNQTDASQHVSNVPYDINEKNKKNDFKYKNICLYELNCCHSYLIKCKSHYQFRSLIDILILHLPIYYFFKNKIYIKITFTLVLYTLNFLLWYLIKFLSMFRSSLFVYYYLFNEHISLILDENLSEYQKKIILYFFYGFFCSSLRYFNYYYDIEYRLINLSSINSFVKIINESINRVHILKLQHIIKDYESMKVFPLAIDYINNKIYVNSQLLKHDKELEELNKSNKSNENNYLQSIYKIYKLCDYDNNYEELLLKIKNTIVNEFPEKLVNNLSKKISCLMYEKLLNETKSYSYDDIKRIVLLTLKDNIFPENK